MYLPEIKTSEQINREAYAERFHPSEAAHSMNWLSNDRFNQFYALLTPDQQLEINDIFINLYVFPSDDPHFSRDFHNRCLLIHDANSLARQQFTKPYDDLLPSEKTLINSRLIHEVMLLWNS